MKKQDKFEGASVMLLIELNFLFKQKKNYILYFVKNVE